MTQSLPAIGHAIVRYVTQGGTLSLSDYKSGAVGLLYGAGLLVVLAGSLASITEIPRALFALCASIAGMLSGATRTVFICIAGLLGLVALPFALGTGFLYLPAAIALSSAVGIVRNLLRAGENRARLFLVLYTLVFAAAVWICVKQGPAISLMC